MAFGIKDLMYLERNVFPYYLIVSRILCSLTLLLYPLLIYLIWSKTLKMSVVFRCLATYTHTFGIIFSATFLAFEPVGIPQLYVIYSRGLTAKLGGSFTFAQVCLVVISITHSIHGLCLSVFYCYHMSLHKCKAWFSETKKLIFVICFSYFVIFSISVGHCFVLPNNGETVEILTRSNQIFKELTKVTPSIIAFSMDGNKNLLIFIIYTITISVIFLSFCLFLFFDYLKYRSQQNRELSTEILKTIQVLRLNYRIRILLAILFQIFPGFLFFFFVFVQPSVEASFLCITTLTVFPFLDIIVEIFSIKLYRRKILSLLKFKKKISLVFQKIVLPSNPHSHGTLFE